MAESSKHIEYVELIYNFLRKDMLPESEHIYVSVDSPFKEDCPPHVCNNFRPDVYYCHGDKLIIGEAKTDDDYCRPHSIKQYCSYFEECAPYGADSIIVLSGSWRISASFANLIRNLKREHNFSTKVFVINEMGCCKEV